MKKRKKLLLGLMLVLFVCLGKGISIVMAIWDCPEPRYGSVVINDFLYYQKVIEEYAKEEGYELGTWEYKDIDFIKGEYGEEIEISNRIILSDEWSISISFSREGDAFERFDIQLSNDDYKKCEKEYIYQMVSLNNRLSTYDYSKMKVHFFVSSNASKDNVDEIGQEWNVDGGYSLEQKVDKSTGKKRIKFAMYGTLEIPEYSDLYK